MPRSKEPALVGIVLGRNSGRRRGRDSGGRNNSNPNRGVIVVRDKLFVLFASSSVPVICTS